METAGDRNSTKKPQRRRKKKISPSFNEDGVLEGPRRTGNAVANKDFVNKEVLYQNGDPLGRRELGKHVVRWIAQGMTAMAADFCAAEERGEVGELEKKIRSGIEFVMQAQPYLAVNPMPRGLEAVCLKASTHYPTLFDNFQRELRNKLQALQTQKAVIQDWKETESWRLLKQLTKSALQFNIDLLRGKISSQNSFRMTWGCLQKRQQKFRNELMILSHTCQNFFALNGMQN